MLFLDDLPLGVDFPCGSFTLSRPEIIARPRDATRGRAMISGEALLGGTIAMRFGVTYVVRKACL